MTSTFNALTATATWERPLVDASGADTALVITIGAPEKMVRDRPLRTPIDVALVLDHSGSMAGEKLRLVKDAVDIALDHLSDLDRVALVVFDDEVRTLHHLMPATADIKATIRRRLARVEPGGSTNLSGGWLTGCHELATELHEGETQPRPRRALLLTDGLVNSGITDPTSLMKHATELRVRGITTTAIGVGQGFDEMLLGGMAEAGGGTFQYIAQLSELSPFFAREISDLLAIAATHPRLRLTLPRGVCAHLLNTFPNRRDGKTITVDLRDLSAGEVIRLVFDVRAAPGEIGTTLTPSIKLSWTDAGTNVRTRFTQSVASLSRAAARDVALAPTDDPTCAQVALERSARTQREAIELDRAGRFAESRLAFEAGHALLMNAPETNEILQERTLARGLAAAPMSPLSEDTRKERVFSQMRRSRGSRPDSQ